MLKQNKLFFFFRRLCNIVVINFSFSVHCYFNDEMDENETELGEEDFDDEEDSDEMLEEGTKYLYSNKNL